MTASFSDLLGKVLVQIHVSEDTIDFLCDDGSAYTMYHEQDCCESVYIEGIDGDIQRLLGQPILVADESSNSEDSQYESETWTFYHLGTNLDTVTIRWVGQSNGYYSEGVSFIKHIPNPVEQAKKGGVK